MKNFYTQSILLVSLIVLASCSNKKADFDASGTFEAEETIISSEVSGTIKQFNVEEGQTLSSNQVIGFIDSTQLFLKKKQLQAQITALLSKRPDVSAQLASLEEQQMAAEKEQKRVSNLVKADAATTKQLDDVNTQLEVIKKQIDAQKSVLGISSQGISNDAVPLQIQIEQTEDQLSKCRIVNPVSGTVLGKYAEANEMTAPGKPLYKIADLRTIILRVYVTGNQLPTLKLNQEVKVLTDDGKGGFKEVTGKITWINDKAEFTPKTIQTKDERANMVYAVKVNVINDGTFKIGMYGEVKF
ncbi:MAG TPA: HlyD family efflux transporter periplasmic adaptor subunit [Bacteroidia bacterium]|nr:HlyD family efflux transporter periplasmic adaptor subunit [Bacteroidia bacterium]